MIYAQVGSYTCASCNFLTDVAEEIDGYRPHSAYYAKKRIFADLIALYDIIDELCITFPLPEAVFIYFHKTSTRLGASLMRCGKLQNASHLDNYDLFLLSVSEHSDSLCYVI